MSFRRLLAAAGAFATMASVPAAAQGEIAFDRAALASPAAAAALYQAIEREAIRACRREHDGLSVLGPTVRRRAVEACVVETVDAAVRAVDAPELAALHGAPAELRLAAMQE